MPSIDWTWMHNVIEKPSDVPDPTKEWIFDCAGNDCRIDYQPVGFYGCSKASLNEIEVRSQVYPEYAYNASTKEHIIFVKGSHPGRNTIFNIPANGLNRFFYTLIKHSYKVKMKGRVKLC